MKKRINFRKLGRTPSHKWAMLRNMVTSLIEHERIVTTTPKAKEVQSLAEKLITTVKPPTIIDNNNNVAKNKPPKDYLHARRQINKIVRTAEAQTKLINVLGPRYQFREGGYTRIMKLAKRRAGDKADMAVLEYVDRPGEIRAARPPSVLRKLLLFDQQQQQQQEGGVGSSSSDATASLELILQRLGIQDAVAIANDAATTTTRTSTTTGGGAGVEPEIQEQENK